MQELVQVREGGREGGSELGEGGVRSRVVKG